MDIATFKYDTIAFMENFYCWWVSQQGDNPLDFPSEMQEAEWFEQFVEWRETQ